MTPYKDPSRAREYNRKRKARERKRARVIEEAALEFVQIFEKNADRIGPHLPRDEIRAIIEIIKKIRDEE